MAYKKTIRMPKADLELVLKVLRSPVNQKRQGIGSLFMPGDKDEGGGYCCLGAMQCAKTGGKVEGGKGKGKSFHGAGLPSMDWLSKVGWTFKDSLGHETDNPYFPSLKMSAVQANDDHEKSFKEIADAIEKCAVGY